MLGGTAIRKPVTHETVEMHDNLGRGRVARAERPRKATF